MSPHTAFCTLFDSRYFSRGVAMCESLVRNMPDARIYLFAFDDLCREAALHLRLPNVTVVSLGELEEDEALRNARQNRSWVEYLWTCTPATIRHVLDRYGETLCTYVDADVYFYDSPAVLLSELEGRDVMITEHRFSVGHDSAASSGIYNVQFLPFRNTPNGRAMLEWWRDACLQSCELNPAEGRCGDQKYLDDWPARFQGVRVLEHLGGGVAPWNVQQYVFRAQQSHLLGREVATGREFKLIFYHFHAFKLTEQGNVRLTNPGYPLGADVVQLIYRPYVRHLLKVGRQVRALGMKFDPHGAFPEPAPGLRARFANIRHRIALYLRGEVQPDGNRIYRLSELGR